MKLVHIVAKLLIIVGALNWGLIGFFQFDLVGKIFGSGMMDMSMMSMGARVVYALVGLAGVYALVRCIGKCCGCSKCGGGSCGSGSCGGSCGCSSKKREWKE